MSDNSKNNGGRVLKSLRGQISMLVFGICAVLFGSLGLAVKSYLSLNNTQNEIEQSFYFSEELTELTQVNLNGPGAKEKVRELLAHKMTILPDSRLNAFSDALRAAQQENKSLLIHKTNFFRKNEAQYRKYLYSSKDYQKNQIKFYALVGGGLLTGLLITLYFFTTYRIFVPIKELYQRMVDFLQNNYSYKFSVPRQDEIGYLHSTFNSLAQGVLSQLEDLEALDKAKSDFVSIASHELRTPLTSVKGSLGLLKTGVAGNMSKQASKLMSIAETETDRLVRLINDLLDLAKIEARQFPLHKKWTSLNELVEKSVHGLEGLAQTANVKLVATDIPDVEIHGDKDRLQQVLTNLISNAIKFSPTGKPVTVVCERANNGAMMLMVSDQGKGIAPEDQEIIFEKFRQATSSTSPLVKGTGLGLTIAKGLVEQHGGEIGVQSAVGQGSTFYFTIPKWRMNNLSKEEAA